MQKTLCALYLLLFCFSALAQQQGKVIDSNTATGVAWVRILQGNQEIISDSAGYFSYMPGGPTLQMSHVGYEAVRFSALPSSSVVRFPLMAKLQQLDEVIVQVGTSEEQLLDQSHAISVLDRKAIASQPDLSPAAVLNTVPGVYMQEGTWSTNRITIRGMGARTPFVTNRIRAYWNNIPLTAGDGSSSLEDIDLSVVDKITVIKGPNSSLYGAGLGGTILLESNPESRNMAYTQAGIGSFGRLRTQLGLNWQGDSGRRTQLHANRLHADGWRQNSRYDRTNLLLLTDQEKGSNERHGLLAYTYVNAEIPSSVDSATFINNPQAAATSWLATGGYENYNKLAGGLSRERLLLGMVRWANSLYGRWQRGEELRPFNYQEERTAIAGTRQSLLWKHKQSVLSFETSLGLEAFHEWYREGLYENDNNQKGLPISSQKQDRLFFNVFGQGRLELDRWQAEAGFNLHQTRYEQNLSTQSATDYQTKIIFSPRLALRYKPTVQSSLFVQASHGLSPISPEDLSTADGRFNSAIQPETGINLESGFRRKANRYFVDLVLYHQFIYNLLVTERTINDLFIGKNAGRTNHSGLELTLDYHIAQATSDWAGTKLLLRGGYNHYRFREFVDGGEDFGGNPVTGVPGWQGTAGIQAQFRPGFFANLLVQGTGSMSVVDENTIRTSPYLLLSAKAGYKGDLGHHWQYSLSVAGQNLGNTHYASKVLVNAPSFGAAPRYYYPGNPASVWLQVRLQYYIE